MGPGYKVGRTALRKAYESWAEARGDKHTMGGSAFKNALVERGFVASKVRLPNVATPRDGWKGVGLKTDVADVAVVAAISGMTLSGISHDELNPKLPTTPTTSLHPDPGDDISLGDPYFGHPHPLEYV